jgi:hypothetical protein
METEQVVWPLRNAPPLAEIVKHFCPTCRREIPAKHVAVDIFVGRGSVLHQTIILNCEHCDARQVIPLEFRLGSWALTDTPYVCVYEVYAAIFKLERQKQGGLKPENML